MRNSTFSVIAILLVVAVALGTIFGFPLWRVWQQGLEGQAKLKRAEQEKLIMVEQAKAEAESAVLRAEAITIVGKAAQDYPEYRHQEFIGAFADALQSPDSRIKLILVPTEANVPIILQPTE